MWNSGRGLVGEPGLGKTVVGRRMVTWRLEDGVRVVFFFQAEDGIRDDLVTGVQTCALPILRRPQERRVVVDALSGLAARPAQDVRARPDRDPGAESRRGRDAQVGHGAVAPDSRSEERRVGKEWTARRETDCGENSWARAEWQ